MCQCDQTFEHTDLLKQSSFNQWFQPNIVKCSSDSFSPNNPLIKGGSYFKLSSYTDQTNSSTHLVLLEPF